MIPSCFMPLGQSPIAYPASHQPEQNPSDKRCSKEAQKVLLPPYTPPPPTAPWAQGLQAKSIDTKSASPNPSFWSKIKAFFTSEVPLSIKLWGLSWSSGLGAGSHTMDPSYILRDIPPRPVEKDLYWMWEVKMPDSLPPGDYNCFADPY